MHRQIFQLTGILMPLKSKPGSGYPAEGILFFHQRQYSLVVILQIISYMKIIRKPDEKEYQAIEPVLAKLLPGDGLLLDHLVTNFQNTKAFILSLPPEKLIYRYAEDKWTIK